ncbi:MAG: host attachment protein [Rhodospirillales bacterium]|nr:host attachment protein [Rhodospirillales bacterium]
MNTRLHPIVWALVADGEHARIVAPTVSRGQFATILEFESTAAHLRSSDMGSERPGKVHESASTTRHAVEPKHDRHRQAKHDFVVDVARQVAERAGQKAFDRLVLVAPGHALHDLREALSPAVAALVVGMLEKDLTKTTDREMGEHLGEWWMAPPVAD